MGRVSKYKKVKNFDPYSKKNKGNIDLSSVGIWGLGDNGRRKKKRSRTAIRLKGKRHNQTDHEFDAPPTQGDEFDLNDLLGTVKKQKVKNELKSQDDGTALLQRTETGNVASIPKTDQDEKQVRQILQVEKHALATEKKKEQETHKRMEGESKRAYRRRTKAETRHIIKNTTVEPNAEKKQKKKDFLNSKKKKRKKGTAMNYGDDDDDIMGRSEDAEPTLVTGERALAALARQSDDAVRFGEQAERPPIFRQLPRGAKPKQEKSETDSKGMTKAQIQKENNAMELMRRKVLAQYASIKAKRKRVGDFHL